MRARSNLIRSFLIVGSFILSAGIGPVQAADRDSVKPWEGDNPIQSAWLAERLPGNTLAYLRIPHPLGFLAMPKGNALDAALRSTGNIEALTSLHDALFENVLEYVPGLEQEFTRTLARKLRSPVEVALGLSPGPSATLAFNLQADSVEAFQQTIETIEINGGQLALLDALDADGFGQILGLPVPTSVHFDVTSGRVMLQAGPSVSAEDFALMVQQLNGGNAHRMQPMEQAIDTSGHGFFGWIDVETALPAAQLFVDPEELASIRESGLDKVRALAFGWGAAADKGRMSLILDMDRSAERQFLPYVANELSATSVGEPDAILTLSIPTVEEFLRIEKLALEAADEERRIAWQEGKQEFRNTIGMSVENMLSAFGPEVIGIFDGAGDYLAIRLRDQRLFEQLVESISGAKPDERRYKRKTFYHAAIAQNITGIDGENVESLGPLGFMFARQGEHLHWYRDGDFLYMASLPQPLIDRLDRGADTRIDTWLQTRQRMDLSESIIGLTGSSAKLPRRIYYVYIEMLQAIADISEAEFDIWSLPTARQAGLPDKGTLGLSVDLGDPYVSVNMVFENNPLESIFSGDMTSIAAIGILAAVAIPAYQDYSVRALVSAGLLAAGPAKTAVVQHYDNEDSFPGPGAAAEISNGLVVPDGIESIEVLPGDGLIVVTFTSESGTEGGQLFIEPSVDGDVLTWTCSSPIPDKRLPAACRGNTPPEVSQSGT